MTDSKPTKPRKVRKLRKRRIPKKAPAKKAAKKKTRKKRVMKPRASLKKDLPKTHAVRQQALADFVSDAESRDEGFHYMREDRVYEKHVTIHIFRKWKHEDGWELQRAAYWAEAQKMLLEKTRDQTVQMLADSMKQLNELRNFAFEWCDPIRDEATGEVLRYPDEDDTGRPHRFAGKPMLAVPIRNFEVAVTSALALDEAVRERRDEVLRLTGQGESASKVAVDPVVEQVNLTPADLRSMAAALIVRRQPELVASALDITPEDHRPPDEE